MRKTSLTYRAGYVTSIYLNLACSSSLRKIRGSKSEITSVLYNFLFVTIQKEKN
jgi:hypothetical protein